MEPNPGRTFWVDGSGSRRLHHVSWNFHVFVSSSLSLVSSTKGMTSRNTYEHGRTKESSASLMHFLTTLFSIFPAATSSQRSRFIVFMTQEDELKTQIESAGNYYNSRVRVEVRNSSYLIRNNTKIVQEPLPGQECQEPRTNTESERTLKPQNL